MHLGTIGAQRRVPLAGEATSWGEGTADKYLEHQPIERQARRFFRAGVDLSPQTLGRSIAAHIDLLSPLAQAIRIETRASALLATDATGLPVLDQDHPLGIRSGTMWCWVGDARWVTFFYSAVGDSKSVKDFLGDDLCRNVQCDGTSVLSFLERAGGKRPGCWAHGRRRFVACARAGDALALVPLRMLRRVFAVERLSALLGETADERLRRRQEQSVPVIAELRAWLDENVGLHPPKTPLGNAIGYLLRQWNRLLLCFADGRLELTNNRVERELRALVLGRKNWLFAYGDLGGERTATILTILGTCIAHRINPRAYLHVVTKLLVHGFPNASSPRAPAGSDRRAASGASVACTRRAPTARAARTRLVAASDQKPSIAVQRSARMPSRSSMRRPLRVASVSSSTRL
jgi:transposase